MNYVIRFRKLTNRWFYKLDQMPLLIPITKTSHSIIFYIFVLCLVKGGNGPEMDANQNTIFWLKTRNVSNREQ